MITRLWERKSSRTSIAASVAIHVAVFAALATITFHYPLVEMFSKPEPVKAVPVRYIKLEPKAGPTASRAARTPRATAPVATMPQVSSIPVGVPAPAVPVSPSTSAIGSGIGVTSHVVDPVAGLGIRPGIPDGRLAVSPSTVYAPQTEGQKAERALSAIYQEYLDSTRVAMAKAERERKPGDWSWGGKDGDKWGWDDKGIHVGGITIPNIVLAALPIPVTGNTEPVNFRAREFMRNDIQMHAGAMSEDEFKAAVRRVRERVDRERREKMEKAKKKEPPCCS